MSSWSYSAKVDIKNLERLARQWGSVDDMLLDVAEQIKNETKKNIKSKGVYDTGDLYNSIEAGLINSTTSYVRDGVSYGVYNEFGTYKMAARPFFTPAIEQFGKFISAWFKELR